eukprot:TRINITY_DN103666_c0_g1_i1.p1 TRINITY_DN103666_c0_g1~~TRINITY_DN103666_c0_g1_i1.p1  ORF type:complete len:164 (+),score=8.81 TRINITY_DN103666_c0_g1_i1:55-492(+)
MNSVNPNGELVKWAQCVQMCGPPNAGGGGASGPPLVGAHDFGRGPQLPSVQDLFNNGPNINVSGPPPGITEDLGLGFSFLNSSQGGFNFSCLDNGGGFGVNGSGPLFPPTGASGTHSSTHGCGAPDPFFTDADCEAGSGATQGTP